MTEDDMEWDLEGSDGDSIEDFAISSSRRSASWRHCEEEEYMEGVRRGVLGGAHVEDLRRSPLDLEEEMDVPPAGDARGNLD